MDFLLSITLDILNQQANKNRNTVILQNHSVAERKENRLNLSPEDQGH